MSYSKFNRNFLIATAVALGVIAGIQGCSSDDTQLSPTAGAAGKVNGTAGKGNGTAGKPSSGGGDTSGGGDAGEQSTNGGKGGDGGATSTDGGMGGEAGEGNPGCDGFLVPCNATCVQDFDNKTLTKIKNGVLPPLPQ